MAPKVLISDKLSETAVNVFRERGVEVTFEPDLGKDKDALLAAIDGFDGLAIRSATKVTNKLLDIDTHLHLDKHLKLAMGYDHVFIAQKEYLPRFKESGIDQVYWLPLACDPDIHGKKTDKKAYEIGFVGSMAEPGRIRLLKALEKQYPVYYERYFLEEMAQVFSQSKIVFNHAVKNDLNMRVFEAMASGSMLLTDEAAGYGLTELFADRKHLVIYRDEKELLELAGCYLGNDAQREEIAEAGRREVLSGHTYEHRVREMLSRLNIKPPEKGAGEDAAQAASSGQRANIIAEAALEKTPGESGADAARLLMELIPEMEVPHQVFNIGNSSPEELLHFIEVLENILGKKAELNMLPMQQGDVLVTYAETAKLEQHCGYRPYTSLETGLQNFVDWYLSDYLRS